ncbi:MAG: hypothetical protein ACM31L_11000 [Actinomycetota bacterium]
MPDVAEIKGLYKRLEDIATEISTSTTPTAALLGRLDRSVALLPECIALQERLKSPNLDDQQFFKLKGEVLVFTRTYRRVRFLVVSLPAMVGSVAIALIIAWIGFSFDWFRTIGERFTNGGLMIFICVLGVMLSVTTQYLKNDNSSVGRLHSLLARLVLAILVPVALVLLFTNQGQLKTEFSASDPDLIAFFCGYSAQLLMDGLNKMVEKAATIIKTI